MYNNLYKSSNVNRDEQVRIIKSNDLVAKKLDVIANNVIFENDNDFDENLMKDISAGNVASLLRDEDEDGFKAFGVKEDSPVGSNKDSIQITNNKVSDIIDKAQKEAKEIVDAAKAEAIKIKEEAYKEGHDKGYSAGYDEGKSKLDDEIQSVENEKIRLNDEYSSKIDELEPALVDVLTDVYEHIFNVEFSDRKEVIYNLAKNTLSSMENGKTYLIKLSSEDFNFFSMQKKDFVKGTGVPLESIEFVEDKSLLQGHAYIETESGIYDCSVSTHMDNLKKMLQVLSFNKD